MARWIPACLCIALTFLAPRSVWPMGWERGVKLGASDATLRGDFADLVGSEHRIGFTGGAFLACPISPRLALQTELLYVTKGAKDEFEVTDAGGNVVGKGHDHWILKYIEVPVLVRVSLAPSSRVRPELCLGPSLGIKLSGTLRTEAPGYPTLRATLSQLKALDPGVVAGFGVSIGRGPYRGLLDLRYATGLSSALRTFGGSLDAVNSVVSLLAGISF